jgi:hypothetical protein
VQSIAATTTRTGLSVHAELDTATYQLGIKIPNAQMKALHDTGTLRRHAWHPEWNYTLNPPQESACRSSASPKRLWRRSGLPEPWWNARVYTAGGAFLGVADGWFDDVALDWEINSVAWHLNPAKYEQEQERTADSSRPASRSCPRSRLDYAPTAARYSTSSPPPTPRPRLDPALRCAQSAAKNDGIAAGWPYTNRIAAWPPCCNSAITLCAAYAHAATRPRPAVRAYRATR